MISGNGSVYGPCIHDPWNFFFCFRVILSGVQGLCLILYSKHYFLAPFRRPYKMLRIELGFTNSFLTHSLTFWFFVFWFLCHYLCLTLLSYSVRYLNNVCKEDLLWPWYRVWGFLLTAREPCSSIRDQIQYSYI